jgi:hypothetical protein
MTHNAKTIMLIRWIARVWALLIAGLVLFIFVGESLDGPVPNPLNLNMKENVILLTMFIAWCGLLLAWKWEGLGATLTLIATAVLSAIMLVNNPQKIGQWLFTVSFAAVPAILLLVCRQAGRPRKSHLDLTIIK